MNVTNRSKKFAILFPAFLLIFALNALSITPIYAQAFTSRIDLSVSPPITYISIKPGEEKQYEIKVENPGESALEITPSLLDFDADGKTGQPIIKKTGTFEYIQIKSDLTTFGKAFLLEPKKSVILPINIDVPQSAVEKEYAMTIFFTFKNANQNQEVLPDSKARVAGTVGSNLIALITHNNSDRGNLIIKKINSWPTIDSFMPLKFSILAENIGKNATSASGSATLTNWQNQEIAKFEFHPDMILAEKTRELREKEFLNSEFRYKKPFLLGIYKITAQVNKNSVGETEKMFLSKTIIVLPFSIFILPLSGFLLYLGYKAVLKKTNSF